MTCRYQQITPRLLPAGAAVAGWVNFFPLEERVLSTAHSESGFKSACLKREVPTKSFRLSTQGAAEFRRRFAMARPFPLCGHAVARRAKVVSGAAGEFRCQSLN